MNYRILAWIAMGALLVAAVSCFSLTRSRLQMTGFQSPTRLESPAYSTLRFANDSQSFFTLSWKTLYHYDLKGNILGEIEFEEYVQDFRVSANNEELGVLVYQPIFGNDNHIDSLIDFLVVNVRDMTISRRVRLLSGDTKAYGRDVLFSPTTNSWIVHCGSIEKSHFFALKSNPLEKHAETVIDVRYKLHGTDKIYSSGLQNLYIIPELEGTVGIDFDSKLLLWNYLSNELIDRPTKEQYVSYPRFFPGPFSRTVATVGTYHENNCLLVFPFDSDVPTHYSAPFPPEGKHGNWRIAGMSDDFKTALFFDKGRRGILSPPSPQRVFVVDVPSMKIIAERTSKSPFIGDVFLSPDGKHVVMFVHLDSNKKEGGTQYVMDIYEVSATEPRPTEQWKEVKGKQTGEMKK